jgi:hypothetical protein
LALRKMVSDFNTSCRFIETDEYQTVFEMRHANYVDIGVVNRLYGNEKKSRVFWWWTTWKNSGI